MFRSTLSVFDWLGKIIADIIIKKLIKLIVKNNSDIKKPNWRSLLPSGKIKAPTDRFSKNFKLKILARHKSGTYREIIVSVIGICPKTKLIAIIIIKNKL